MSDRRLDAMRDLVQEDVGNRGLRADPERNLISETSGDFAAACASLAGTASPGVVIVTGFFISTAEPPAGETDGPLGAVFLARALVSLGVRIAIATDHFCVSAVFKGLDTCGLLGHVSMVTLPRSIGTKQIDREAYGDYVRRATSDIGVTHLLAIERVGPSYTDRCRTMRGIDVTDSMSPAHWLFETDRRAVAIGIGDGGNEIGMGKVPRDVIARNIPRGDLIACRVPADHLIVAGVSNWGAYALAAGVYALRGVTPAPDLFDPEVERRILEAMVAEGPLVDGVLGRQSATVDGLSWERYAIVLPRLRELIG